jgi:hypothetical protein
VPEMSLSPVKQEILETMLLDEKPVRAMEIAKETKKEFPQVMMHLLGLVRMGYVTSPEKSLYVISSKGKQALGIPQTNKEKAIAILAYAPHDKAFEFYSSIGQPLHLHAHSLRDFANKLEKVSVASIEFHTKRDDFEVWLMGLGDEELAKKINLLKKKMLAGEELRKQLHGIVDQRYLELINVSGQIVPAEKEHNHDHTQ